MEQALAIASQTALVTLKYFAENPNHLVAVLGGVSTALLGFPLCIDNMLKQARFDELKAARTQASLQTWKNLVVAATKTQVANDLAGKTVDASDMIKKASESQKKSPPPKPQR